MSDAKIPSQATEPNPEVASSQQAQAFAPPNPGGSALTDANIDVPVNTSPEGEPIANPIASNFSSTAGTADAKTADSETLAGPYPAEQKHMEEGAVNLHNNPDVPDSNLPGTLPDTDAITLPLQPDVHLQD